MSKEVIEINDVLKSEIKIDPIKNKASIDTWNKLGPLTLAEIFKNCNSEPEFNDDQVEFKIVDFGNGIKQG